MSRWTALASCFAALLAVSALAADEPRYAATWADGTRSFAAEIDQWGSAAGQPTLAGQALFDAKRPARLILDTALPRVLANESFLEFQSGDRLRARVVEFREADESAGLLAHLVIEPRLTFELPGVFKRLQIRVQAEAVRRIVVEPTARGSLKPHELRTTAGELVPFRALSWRAGGVEVLTDAGVKHHRFDDLAALALPQEDPWQAWLKQLAVLSPGLDSPQVQMELSDGSQLTTSRERLRAVTAGGDGPDHWFHLCQPAWSLDLLAVPHRQVRVRKLLDPTHTPLPAFALTASRGQGIVLAIPTASRVNESLAGGPLRWREQEFGWGFAMHAPHELLFDLPSSARRFHTRLALDPAVGSGGCVRGRIEFKGKALFASPLLIGSEKIAESGTLAVGAGPLKLIADAAAHEHSKDADPLDIRDDLSWLEPTVEHDGSLLRRAVERCFPAAHPVLASFTPDPAEAGNWRLLNRFDEADLSTAAFGQLLALDGPVTLTRRIAVGAPAGTLRLTLGRSLTADPATLEIWVDSNRLVRQTLPRQEARGEPLRIEVPFQASRENSVQVTIRFAPAGKSTLIDCRALHADHGENMAANR